MVRNCSFILNKKGNHLEGSSRSCYSANSDVVSNFRFCHFRTLLQLENDVLFLEPDFVLFLNVLICFCALVWYETIKAQVKDIEGESHHFHLTGLSDRKAACRLAGHLELTPCQMY